VSLFASRGNISRPTPFRFDLVSLDPLLITCPFCRVPHVLSFFWFKAMSSSKCRDAFLFFSVSPCYFSSPTHRPRFFGDFFSPTSVSSLTPLTASWLFLGFSSSAPPYLSPRSCKFWVHLLSIFVTPPPLLLFWPAEIFSVYLRAALPSVFHYRAGSAPHAPCL